MFFFIRNDLGYWYPTPTECHSNAIIIQRNIRSLSSYINLYISVILYIKLIANAGVACKCYRMWIVNTIYYCKLQIQSIVILVIKTFWLKEHLHVSNIILSALCLWIFHFVNRRRHMPNLKTCMVHPILIQLTIKLECLKHNATECVDVKKITFLFLASLQ